jgi:hypothetical protein
MTPPTLSWVWRPDRVAVAVVFLIGFNQAGQSTNGTRAGSSVIGATGQNLQRRALSVDPRSFSEQPGRPASARILRRFAVCDSGPRRLMSVRLPPLTAYFSGRSMLIVSGGAFS